MYLYQMLSVFRYTVSCIYCPSRVQDLSNVSMKCLVPVLEKLLEDDGFFPLRQYLHLKHNAKFTLTFTVNAHEVIIL